MTDKYTSHSAAARKIAMDTCNSFGVSISLPPPETTGGATESGSAAPTATESSTATTSDSAAEPTETEGGNDGDDSDGGDDGSDGGDSGDDSEGGDPTENEDAAPTDADGAASGLKVSVGGGVLAALLAVAAYL